MRLIERKNVEENNTSGAFPIRLLNLAVLVGRISCLGMLTRLWVLMKAGGSKSVKTLQSAKLSLAYRKQKLHTIVTCLRC